MSDNANAVANVIAGLQDIYLPVDALHIRCITFLNGGDEEFEVLLTCAKEVLLTAWWKASDSLVFLREVGLIRSGEALYPRASLDIPEGHDSYDDDPCKAIASLEGAIGEVEQQIYHLVHSCDREAADVKRTKEALLLIGHLTSIALERVEKIGGLRFGPAPSQKPDSDITEFIRELGQMYLNDPNRMTETESAFIGTDTQARTREIGYHLHELGGKGAMLRAHDAILGEHGRGAAGMLRIAWAGIGLWMK
jgi:hypothetical protein